MSTRQIAALLTRQAVYQGDHGQDITIAVAIDPDETVGALVERALTKHEWRSKGDTTPQDPDPDAYLTLRLGVTL